MPEWPALADEFVNGVAVVAIAVMAVDGVLGTEPYAAIASIALGRSYLKLRRS